MALDSRGLTLTGATNAQAKVFDDIVGSYLDYKLTTFPELKALCEEAPNFGMAHIFKGLMLLSMGVNSTVTAAKNCADHVSKFQNDLTGREKKHVQALRAWANGDTKMACHEWDEVLFEDPLDILALKFQHFALFWRGQPLHMKDAASRVLPAWSEEMQGYSHLLGMYAFGLEETGNYSLAEKFGKEAVERHPDDLWAIHAVAHVYEMESNVEKGISWLNQPLTSWKDRNPFKDHLWWHTAMFAMEHGEYQKVLDLYDSAIWPDESTFYLDIQNAASILARLESSNVNVGDRWEHLAKTSEDRKGDHVLMFTEPHYTMALGSAQRHSQIDSQIKSLTQHAKISPKSNKHVIENLTQPICRAIQDFYKGNFKSTVDILMPLRYDYQPIGGSHAQRDVFNFYLIDAAIQSGQLILAKSLLAERVAIHTNSYGSWEKYAHVCTKLGDQKNASFAQSEVSRLSKQLH